MTEELELAELGPLARPPAIDLINERQRDLLRSRAAKGCNEAELAQFLELCVAYQLDPYAQEAWCAKGRGKDGGEGRLLIMVGRDGLRKIAHRNNLSLDGDVVREHDRFHVTRNPGRERVIEHEYEGGIETRGGIVGAWAEVFDQVGAQRGYFYAPLSEYRPTNEQQLKFSPWGSQESVMILAAAERQALRQATPLGGLLAEGEDARIGEPPLPDMTTADQLAEWAPNAELAGAILAVIARAAELGHAGLSDYATIELTLKGRSEAVAQAWVSEAWDELAKLEAESGMNGAVSEEDIAEAEIVDESGSDQERAEALERRALELLALADEADTKGEEAEAERFREEAAEVHEEARAIADPQQGDLGL